MNFNELLDSVTELSDSYVANMVQVPANRLGLDPRCGKVFVSDNTIAVYKENDRAIKYYGGFEYINDTDRHEIGDYVFYSNTATRVDEALEFYMSENEYYV
jgi:hypothetical protein